MDLVAALALAFVAGAGVGVVGIVISAAIFIAALAIIAVTAVAFLLTHLLLELLFKEIVACLLRPVTATTAIVKTLCFGVTLLTAYGAVLCVTPGRECDVASVSLITVLGFNCFCTCKRVDRRKQRAQIGRWCLRTIKRSCNESTI
jgi:hypothetical protein